MAAHTTEKKRKKIGHGTKPQNRRRFFKNPSHSYKTAGVILTFDRFNNPNLNGSNAVFVSNWSQTISKIIDHTLSKELTPKFGGVGVKPILGSYKWWAFKIHLLFGVVIKNWHEEQFSKVKS